MPVAALSHVPLYVYALFVGLLWLGISRCFPRTVRVERIALMPVLIAVFGIRNFVELFPAVAPGALAAACAGAALGFGLGWRRSAARPLACDLVRRTVALPGDATILAVLMAMFALRFGLNFGLAVHAAWIADPTAAPAAAAAWGALAGITIGRGGNQLRRFQVAARQAPVTG